MSESRYSHRGYLRAGSSREAPPNVGAIGDDEPDRVPLLALRSGTRVLECARLAERRICCRERNHERTQCFQMNGEYDLDLYVGTIAILMCMTLTAVMISRLHAVTW